MSFFTPILLLLNCFNLFFFRKWLGPVGLFVSSSLLMILTIFVSIVILSYQQVNSFYTFFDLGRWFFVLDIIDSNLVFISDSLALLTSILVLTLSLFAQYFGVEYMYREAFILRLVYLLNLFATSVVMLFFVFDFFLVLIVWELIGLFSLLLVNFYSVRIYTIKAAFKTFLFSRISDLFIFIAFLIIISLYNTTDLALLFIQIPFSLFFTVNIGPLAVNVLDFLALLIALSGAVKAAQFSFHVWLPDAMEAPTPASALIHSSTLVIMGVYFIIRFNILFEFAYITNLFMATLGALTIAVGAVSASFQNDIKKLVAYSTVSQMGYLFCGCGFMCYNEVLFYLGLHAVNKAFLFILVGYVVHFFGGNTDMRFMGSLFVYSVEFAFIFLVISLNLTGLPYTAGFLAKELLVFQTFQTDLTSLFVRVCWFVSFLFTPFYMIFLNYNVFFRSKQGSVKLLNHSLNNNSKITSYFSMRLLNSLLVSRPTIAVLLLALTLALFAGEFLIEQLLNTNSTYDTILGHSWLRTEPLFTDMPLIASSTLTTVFGYTIYLFTFSALRLLKRIY